MTTRQKNKIIRLRQLGLSIRDLALCCKTSPANVHRIIKKYLNAYSA